jgi:hypothetical protein
MNEGLKDQLFFYNDNFKDYLKISLKIEKARQLKNKKAPSPSPDNNKKAVRFVLGNKVEVLTASNLL